MKLVIISLIFLVLNVAFCAKIPEEIEKCDYQDQKCLLKASSYILENHFNGLPSMGLVQLDPVEVSQVSILEDKNSQVKKPISINLWFKNWKIHGLKRAKITKMTGFNKNDVKRIILGVTVPKLELIGDYKINGQVLVLPIQGDGKSNLTLENVKLSVLTKGDLIERKGKKYLKVIDNPRINANTTRLYVKLDNLFNGNKALGDTMNQFLNDNWSEIFEELKVGILDALGTVFSNILNNVFLRIPYNEMFKSEDS